MSQPALATQSLLPAAGFLVPLAGSLLVLLGRRAGEVWWRAVALVASGATLAVGLATVLAVVDGAVLTCWDDQLRVDGLSALMVLLIGGIGFLATLYSLPYLARRRAVSAVARNGRLWVFYWLLPAFLANMVWGCVTNNVVMLFVAVEATTLTSGLLVAFHWDRRALEAGYKYLMLLTISITFALFGCVLLYAGAAATDRLGGASPLLLSEVGGVVHLIPAKTAAITVAFLVIGFGAKAGVVPFHPWLPDAHAEAPAPISVLLSAVMIKMAAYALARTVSLFYPSWPQVTLFLVVLGCLTMLLGIVLALAQDDLKRLLAYSSVSQMGYILVGVGLGSYLGAYGGLFHLLNHAVYKAMLFLCVGAVVFSTGLRRISELGGLARTMPITGACFLCGALAIAGLPPMSGFWSKLTIYLALAQAELWWAVAIALITSVLTMVVLVRAAYAVFWARGRELADGAVHEVPVAMWAPMVTLAAITVLLGVLPQTVYPLLDQAASVLATLGR